MDSGAGVCKAIIYGDMLIWADIDCSPHWMLVVPQISYSPHPLNRGAVLPPTTKMLIENPDTADK